MVRRLVALVVVLVVGLGALKVVSGLFGSDGNGQASPGSTTSSTSPGTTETSDPTEATVTDQTDAPTTTDASDGVPTPENKAKVLILGDSDAGNFGPYLMNLLDANGVTESDLFYKVSSGLSRPDFFDWPAEIATRLPEADPDIVVVTYGGNDAQDLLIDEQYYPVDTPEWRKEYGKRVGDVMDMLTADGRTLVWVGIPNASEEAFTSRLQVLRDVTLAEIEERPESVVYIDTWNRFVGLSGGYADYVIDPRDGKGKNVRASDGFHLNMTGSEILALDIAKAVEEDLRARGAAI